MSDEQTREEMNHFLKGMGKKNTERRIPMPKINLKKKIKAPKLNIKRFLERKLPRPKGLIKPSRSTYTVKL